MSVVARMKIETKIHEHNTKNKFNIQLNKLLVVVVKKVVMMVLK